MATLTEPIKFGCIASNNRFESAKVKPKVANCTPYRPQDHVVLLCLPLESKPTSPNNFSTSLFSTLDAPNHPKQITPYPKRAPVKQQARPAHWAMEEPD